MVILAICPLSYAARVLGHFALSPTTITKHVAAGLDQRFDWTGPMPYAIQIAALVIAAEEYPEQVRYRLLPGVWWPRWLFRYGVASSSVDSKSVSILNPPLAGFVL
jgi:hypothetical protein